eukprot:gb/GECG01008052.1/.p1 GENE.gb/GECG01008052.1/~~gb/GECG01008052.1/.p1  ORF type:complete len:660 (+),score=106.30 gb/GECG01008052.1/:1-1980(+)
MSSPSMEGQLKDLKKKKSNKYCFECQTQGPRYICVTHGTFVCEECSGILRSFNFRVKGLGLGSFKQEEINGLIGNKEARKIWLAKWDDSNLPHFNDGDIAAKKAHIQAKYIDKKWYDPEGASKKKHGTGSSRHSVSSTPKSNSKGDTSGFNYDSQDATQSDPWGEGFDEKPKGTHPKPQRKPSGIRRPSGDQHSSKPHSSQQPSQQANDIDDVFGMGAPSSQGSNWEVDFSAANHQQQRKTPASASHNPKNAGGQASANTGVEWEATFEDPFEQPAPAPQANKPQANDWATDFEQGNADPFATDDIPQSNQLSHGHHDDEWTSFGGPETTQQTSTGRITSANLPPAPQQQQQQQEEASDKRDDPMSAFDEIMEEIPSMQEQQQPPPQMPQAPPSHPNQLPQQYGMGSHPHQMAYPPQQVPAAGMPPQGGPPRGYGYAPQQGPPGGSPPPQMPPQGYPGMGPRGVPPQHPAYQYQQQFGAPPQSSQGFPPQAAYYQNGASMYPSGSQGFPPQAYYPYGGQPYGMPQGQLGEATPPHPTPHGTYQSPGDPFHEAGARARNYGPTSPPPSVNDFVTPDSTNATPQKQNSPDPFANLTADLGVELPNPQQKSNRNHYNGEPAHTPPQYSYQIATSTEADNSLHQGAGQNQNEDVEEDNPFDFF